jgi:hypothetical protein
MEDQRRNQPSSQPGHETKKKHAPSAGQHDRQQADPKKAGEQNNQQHAGSTDNGKHQMQADHKPKTDYTRHT